MPYIANRSAFVLIPLQPMLDWVNAQGNELTLDDLLDECEVYLVNSFETDQELDRELDANWAQLFELELNAWTHEQEKWPQNRSLDTFFEWFRFMPFNGVHDLVDGALEIIDEE